MATSPQFTPEEQTIKNTILASRLTPREGRIIQIRDTILKALTSHMTQNSQTHTALFQISWNPLAFLKDQYGDEEQPELKTTLVLTGSATDAQATTCGDYINQVWPETGSETLDALQAAILHPEHYSRYNKANGTELDIQLSSDKVLVNATGTTTDIADIGEQLMWLGAACRASPTPRISYSTPQIVAVKSPAPSFVVNFAIEDIESKEIPRDGTCWHAMFFNPVIVRGFPILARNHNEKGLEIPLDIMTEMAGATCATIFTGQLVIKGFSAMFVPTLRIEDSILWNVLIKEDGDRVPYTAIHNCSIRATYETVDYECLETSRMFLSGALTLPPSTMLLGPNITDERVDRPLNCWQRLMSRFSKWWQWLNNKPTLN